MNTKKVIPTFALDDPDQYGMGSWVKGNVGNIMQGVGGVLSVIPVTSVAGIALAGAGKMVQNNIDTKEAEQGVIDSQKQQYNNSLIKERLSSTTNPDTTMPVFSNGGKLPRGRATLTEAKEYIKLYPEEMKMGEEVEYEHTGNQKLAQRIAADHVKDYLKMTDTPGYYSAMKEAGISDELNKMADGGFFEFKNGGIYIKPSKRGSFTAWAKKHNMGVQEAARRVMANKDNYSSAIVKKANFAKNFAHELGGYMNNPSNYSLGGDISKYTVSGYAKGGNKPDGGPVTEPIYPRQYSSPVSFGADPEYLFQKSDSTVANNYYYPMNVKSAAARSNPNTTVLPTFVGHAPGYQPYTDRTDMPAAGYRIISPNKQDTSFTYRNVMQDRSGKDSIAYTPGSRIDVQKATNILNNPKGKGEPSVEWMNRNNAINEYYTATGKTRPSAFATGGEVSDFLTEYKNGGTHEQNPYGGIPLGNKATVEEGEYKFDDDQGSYIFSNRLPYKK